jgi:ATP phosphoribosyltransferase
MLLLGAIAANNMVGLKMNVEEKNLKKVLSLLTSLKNPTISSLSEEKWRAVEIVINENIVRTLIPKLKLAGAQGIIEYPLNKLIY